jgi:hypothetical protein
MDVDGKQWQMDEWGKRCFGADHMSDARIRALRLLEEAVEFAQSVGVQFDQGRALFNYVYSRQPGEPVQELGGVFVTALVAASALGRKASEVIEAETSRVLAKSTEHFRQRNQVKLDEGFQ